jgi:predicted DNA-binding transcriptional regulator AlpA
MQNQPAPVQAEALRRSDAARLLGISVSLLRKLERNGNAPKSVRLNRAVIYPITELRHFMQERLSTQ